MATLAPRAVFVTRETDYELLLARHATVEQARFYLQTRGQSLATLEARHQQFGEVMAAARAAVPTDWRRASVGRADLDRFLFTAEDVVVAVGQDGLVPNVAKYLAGQPVIGINPAPDLYDGVLVRHRVEQLGGLLPRTWHGDADFERRTMVEGILDTGERLCALNELFVGHRSHQSARYHIEDAATQEEQSSSGVIVATGTGATGWARSIMEATNRKISLSPQERALGWFVREPFPTVATGNAMRAGKLTDQRLKLTSRMNDGGIIFADGIEQDFLSFDWGRRVEVSVATNALSMVA